MRLVFMVVARPASTLVPSQPAFCGVHILFSVLSCVLEDQSTPRSFGLCRPAGSGQLEERMERREGRKREAFNLHTLPMSCWYSLAVDAFLYGQDSCQELLLSPGSENPVPSPSGLRGDNSIIAGPYMPLHEISCHPDHTSGGGSFSKLIFNEILVSVLSHSCTDPRLVYHLWSELVLDQNKS